MRKPQKKISNQSLMIVSALVLVSSIGTATAGSADKGGSVDSRKAHQLRVEHQNRAESRLDYPMVYSLGIGGEGYSDDSFETISRQIARLSRYIAQQKQRKQSPGTM